MASAVTGARVSYVPAALGGAVIFGAAALTAPPEFLVWRGIAGTALGAVLGWLAAHDAAHHLLPNRVQYPALVGLTAYILLASLSGIPGWGRALLGGIAIGVALLFIAVIGRGGLGLGDVKLGVILGMWTGWVSQTGPIQFLFLSFLLGGMWALGLILLRRADRTTRIAFGPFLVAGAAVAVWLPA